MKSVILALSFLLGTSAFAKGVSYTCKEKDGGQVIMSLDQIGDAKIVEGVKYKFNLQLIDADSDVTMLDTEVTVKTADVQFFFKGKGVSGQLYLDELDQSYAIFKGTTYYFDCGGEE
jgi:hypothetical protein